MGADEMFGGCRRHLECLLAARYQAVPKSIRRRVVAPGVNRLAVAAGGRGLRYMTWAKQFVSFAELPEEADVQAAHFH